jgi:hypothetical protein
MPHIPVSTSEWKYETSFTAKVGKLGSKLILHGNGRTSLNFSISVRTTIPWDNPTKVYNPMVYVRCKWFDPEFVLMSNDVVRVSGIMTKVDKDIGLLVNQCELVAKFVKKRDLVKDLNGA